MAGRAKSLQREAQQRSLMTYDMYCNRLAELSMCMFRWEGLPDTIDERFLELTLFQDGSAIFFQDEVMGFLALQVAYNGPLDVYRVPVKRRAYATSGYQALLDETNSVMIWNNALRTNTSWEVQQYAYRLALIDRTIDVNLSGQKTPVLIVCDENQRLTMQNLYMSYDGFEPFIFGQKGLDVTGVKVLKTDVPFISDKLQLIKRQLWQEALNSIGIESMVNEKSERLVTGEAQANAAAVAAQRYSRLNARQQAADAINRMFGLNVSVSFRSQGPVMPDSIFADLSSDVEEVGEDE